MPDSEPDPANSFTPADEVGVVYPHSDHLMITAVVANYDVARIMIDTGISIDVIFYKALLRFNMDFDMKPIETTITGFTGAGMSPVGHVSLPFSMGNHPLMANGTIDFLVLDAPSAYNNILGRPALSMFRAVPSTYHLKLKFPIDNMVGEVRGEQMGARRSYMEALKYRPRLDQVDLLVVTNMRPPRDDVLGRDEPNRPIVDPETKEAPHVLPTEELLKIELDVGKSGRTTRIGSQLGE